MKLTRIEWQGYIVPFKDPVRTAGSDAPARQGLLLQLYSDTGLAVWGEASPVGPGNEQQLLGFAEQLEGVSDALFRMNITDAGSLHTLSAILSKVSSGLRFGIETALCDLVGKSEGRSIASVLGGTPRTMPVNALLTAESSEDAARQTREAVTKGFSAVKLKVGFLPVACDVERVEAVRSAAPGISIRLDANQGWSVPQAIEAIRLMELHGLEYVEQPVAAADIAGMRRVRNAVSTPIAADESVTSVETALRLVRTGTADVLIVKAARLGLLEASKVMHMAVAYRKPAIVTSSFETGVGLAASLHLAASVPDCGICGLATATLLEDTLVSSKLSPDRGLLACPSGPGLGAEPDPAAVSRYASHVRGRISR